MEVKVSVIVPVHNTEKFLTDCIESLMLQTLQEIECIFVDDASSDNSLKILKDYEKKYPEKMKVIALKENVRQGGARNIGIRESKGEYIAFVDSDDFIAKDTLEVEYRRITETESDAVFIQYSRVEENVTLQSVDFENVLPEQHWTEEILNYSNKFLSDNSRADLIAHAVTSVWSALWRRELITSNNIFFPEKLAYEDNYWVPLMLCYVSKITFIEGVRYFYRYNSTSTTHVKNNSYQIYDRIKIENILFRSVHERGLFDKYRDVFEYIYVFRATFNTMDLVFFRFDNFNTVYIRLLLEELVKKYPNWKKNLYLKKIMPVKRRFIYTTLLEYPSILPYIYISYIKLRIKIAKFIK